MTTTNIPEIRVALLGLQMVLKIGANRIHLQYDSPIVVNAISINRSPNWLMAKWFIPIQEIIEKLEDFRISHIYKEENHEVDMLAKNVGNNI